MATEDKKKSEALTIPDQVHEAIEGAAKLLGVATVELWGIFVRQYVVRGISEAFFGTVIVAVAIYLENYIGLWWLLAGAPSLVLFYGAIQNLGNPKYFAIEDITKKVKSFKKGGTVEVVKDRFVRF